MNKTDTINVLRRQVKSLQLCLESREHHIQLLQDDVRNSLGVIHEQAEKIVGLQATQHHPGCNRYIQYLQNRLLKGQL